MPDVSARLSGGLPNQIEPRHLRFVITESMIGAFMGGLLPAIVILLVRPFAPAHVLGSNSIASGLLFGTFGPGTTLPIVLRSLFTDGCGAG